MRRSLTLTAVVGAFVLVPLCARGEPETIEFPCGDVNLDGAVSLADAQYLAIALFTVIEVQAGPSPWCHGTWEANGDGKADLSDVVALFDYSLFGAPAPRGSDAFHDSQCDTVSFHAPIDDPEAELVVLDAQSDGESGSVLLTIGVSSSVSLGSYRGVITGPFGGGELELEDLSGAFEHGLKKARSVGPDRIAFGLIADVDGDRAIPAGERVPVLQITACLASGTPAGEYELVVTDGELADAERGLTIQPALEGSTLALPAAVPFEAGCESGEATDTDPEELCWTTLTVPPVDPGPDEPTCADGFDPELDLAASYRLEAASASPGGSVSVPVVTRANLPVEGVSFSVAFDSSSLTATLIEPVFSKPDGSSYAFNRYFLDNDNGFASGVVVFSFTDADQNPPANEDVELARIHFDVSATAPTGNSELVFENSASGVRNQLTLCGAAVAPERANEFLLIASSVEILPEVTTFVRGDSNRDGLVDISDPRATLDYLFVSGGDLPCFDAADANDDGALDVSDAIRTLGYLFLGLGSLPPPFPEIGVDPTPDGMSCSMLGQR